MLGDEHSSHSSDETEGQHFANVVYSFASYSSEAMLDIDRMDKHFHTLSSDDQSLLIESIMGRISKIKDAVISNQQFLNILIQSHASVLDKSLCVFSDDDDGGHTHGGLIPDGACGAGTKPSAAIIERNSSKVRSTLRQFVRDWSKEGEAERQACYGPILDAIMRRLPLPAPGSGLSPPRIVCPGSGLGRLPFEILRRGYSCQGNEFSYFMLLGSNFILNYVEKSEIFTIQPYCLSTSNRVSHDDHLHTIRIPDVPPSVEAGLMAEERQKIRWAIVRKVVEATFDCEGDIAPEKVEAILGAECPQWVSLVPQLFAPIAETVSAYRTRRAEIDGGEMKMEPGKEVDFAALKMRIMDQLTEMTCDQLQLGEEPDFSMCAGEFVEVYSSEENLKAWDCVATCFFIDTAKNIIQYIRCIALTLDTGALWVNLGPFLYHFADVPNEISIELSYQEVRKIIEKWFVIEEENLDHDCYYTTNNKSMMQVVYHTVFFTAKRNSTPVEGYSNPVH